MTPQQYTLDMIIFPNDQMEKFNEFAEKYKNISDKQILREIVNVKGQVSKKVIQQHINNLDALSKMEGFVTEHHKKRIDLVKEILSAENVTSDPGNQELVNPEGQFFFGSSLLLWFLTLAAIWRRPFFRRFRR